MLTRKKTGPDHTPIPRSAARVAKDWQQQKNEGVRWELTNVTVFILVIFSEWSLVQNVVV